MVIYLYQAGEVMTARCKACWLKLALTGFQMREADHDDLRKLLPTSMQDAIPLAADRPTSLHWAPNRGQMIRMKHNSSSTPNVWYLIGCCHDTMEFIGENWTGACHFCCAHSGCSRCA